MGQKVNPNGLRIGISRAHQSTWIANKSLIALNLKQDIEIRRYLEKKLADAVVSHIDISRVKNTVKVEAFVQYIGKVIKQDDNKYIQEVRNGLFEIVNGYHTPKQIKELKDKLQTVELQLFAVEVPSLDATLVAKDIAKQLEGRSTSRVVQKKAIARVMKAGARGIKTMVKGRVNGAEIARSEQYREGVLSLHTLCSDIDYALAEAHTTYGILGCKVWISRPENYRQLERQNRAGFDRRNVRGQRPNGQRRPRNTENSKQVAKKGE